MTTTNYPFQNAITPSGATASTVDAAFGGMWDESGGPGADEITITSPEQYHTYQQDGSNQYDIPISGTYGGTPTAIEARFNGGSWATIDASPAGGTFSGTLSNQAAGQGLLEVRFTNDTLITDSVANILISDIFLVVGQSNAQGSGTNAQVYTGSGVATMHDGADWVPLADPGTPNTGSPYPLLANLYDTEHGFPCAFINAAAGGTAISQWADGQALHTAATTAVTAAGGAIKAILWYQGESDVAAATTQATYQTALSALLDAWQTDMGLASVKMVAALIANFTGETAADINAIRLAIINRWENDADILPGPVGHDQTFALHWTTDAELLLLAQRWWRCLLHAFYGGAELPRGPRLSSATYNADTITAAFTSQGNLANGTDETGFALADNAGSRTITNTSVGATLTLVADQALVDTVLLSFASGNAASGATIRDSGTYPLPPEPIIDSEVTEAAADPVLTADPGSYAITGTEPSLEQGYVIGADTGSFSLSGVDASLEQGQVINPEEGSYSLVGTDVNFTEGFGLTTDVGIYLISGVSALLLQHSILSAAVGSYIVTGVPATLSENLENIVGGRFIVGQVYYPGFKQAQVNN